MEENSAMPSEIELLAQAKQIVDSGVVKGFTAKVLKQAADNDFDKFNEYLKAIAEQGWDPDSLKPTIEMYGEDLVDIAKALHPAPDWLKKKITESTKPLVRKLLKENLKKNSAIELINDFGMLTSMNLSQVTKMGKDQAATNELTTMMQNIRKPIINGQTYFDIIKDVNSIIANPKMLSAVLGKIREFLIYIEPRIQQFVLDGEKKTSWLQRIEKLKTLYKAVIQP